MPAIDIAGENDAEKPARYAIGVTPSDTVDLVNMSRGLFVGGAGNLSVVMAGNSATVVFTGVPAGAFLPLRVHRVNSTSTTATNIVAVW